jgi:hypothetical protein
MGANKDRGEVELILDGTPYVLRPSYEAIAAFEADTGRGLLELAKLADAGTLTSSEVAAIAVRSIQAHGRATKDAMLTGVNARKIGELIVETPGGMMLAMRTLALMLFRAATGGYTASGEAKAAAATETASVA